MMAAVTLAMVESVMVDAMAQGCWETGVRAVAEGQRVEAA